MKKLKSIDSVMFWGSKKHIKLQDAIRIAEFNLLKAQLKEKIAELKWRKVL